MKRLARTTAVLLTAALATLGGVASATAYQPDEGTTGESAEPAMAPQADAHPCGARWYHSGVGRYVQSCPDWAPADSPYGAHRYPVYDLSVYPGQQIGTIYAPGDDWFVCQRQFDDRDPYAGWGYYNNWWAYTMADNGRWGWVPEVYFKGGGNNQPDAGLVHC